MSRRVLGALAGVTAAAATLTFTVGGTATAAPDSKGSPTAEKVTSRSDNLPNPRAEKAAELRKEAVNKLVKGEASVKTINGRKVIELQAPETGTAKKAAASKKRGKGVNAKKGRYVEYDPDQTTKIFTTLAEFGTKTKAATGGDAGPLHNQIAKPDRKVNNSTYWVPDFSRTHYEDMFDGEGESFRSFYKAQSQGRFDVTTEVTDWVQVPYNEARYGHNPVSGDGTSEAEGYWSFVGDSLTSWYNAEKKAGKTDAEIKKYLAQFDTWDRYDYDGDGDFNEPDGYIDHYQAIHAGEGEEAGGERRATTRSGRTVGP